MRTNSQTSEIWETEGKLVLQNSTFSNPAFHSSFQNGVSQIFSFIMR